MTKTLAVFPTASPSALVPALTQGKFSWRNPGNGAITYLSPEGDQLEAISEASAMSAFLLGHPIQLWRSPEADIRIWRRDEGTVISFDGHSETDESRLLAFLRNLGFEYWLDHV